MGSVIRGETNRQTVRRPENIGRNALSNRKVKRKVGAAKRQGGWWEARRKQFAREADWKIGVTGASHQPGDWPVKRDTIIDTG